MRSYLTLVALIGVIPLAYAEPQELSTSCSYCTTADQFAVHGAAALDVVEGNKPIYQRILAIKPITVHNTATGKAAKVNVGLDLSNSVALFIFSFGIPSTTGVVADAEFLDGSGTISRKVSNQLIARTIREKGIKSGDVASCRRSDCAISNKEDDNGNIGEGSSAGRGGYVGQGFDWTGLSLDRFTNTRTGAVYNQFAYRGRIDRGLTLGHRTAIVRDTETNPRTGETYENEYRTDYLCGQRSYKCSANVKQK